MLSNESQVSLPHNSTLIEEDLKIDLKDIIPQDLSAIIGEFLTVIIVHVPFNYVLSQRYTTGTSFEEEYVFLRGAK